MPEAAPAAPASPAAPANPLKPAAPAKPAEPAAPAVAKSPLGLTAEASPAEEEKKKKDIERRAESAARLKRDEAKLYREREQLKAEREKWLESQRTELQEAQRAKAELAEAKRLAKENPDELLGRLGLSFEELAKRKIQGDKRTPEQIVQAELQKFEMKMKAEREEVDRRTREQQATENTKQFIDNNQKQMKRMIDSDKDKYELCSRKNGQERAWKLIEDTYAQHSDPKTGQLKDTTPADIAELFNPLNTSQLFTFALEAVESTLLEESFEEYRSSKKIQQRLKAEEEQAAKDKLEKDKAALIEAAKQGVTKTGFFRRQSASTPPGEQASAQPKPKARMLSRPERIELAKAARLMAEAKAEKH
jgi:hypothetical protein